MNLYANADKAIKAMNRANLKAFNRLKLADFDELKLIRAVADLYDASIALARKKYLEIAVDAYIEALLEADIKHDRAKDMAEDDITTDWVLDMLEESDPVTLYEFMAESDRKKHRLIEALAAVSATSDAVKVGGRPMATASRNVEIDKALKYWTAQIAQYADNCVFNARLDAFKAVGIKRVKWITQHDERVCEDCEELDGRIFDIDKVPPPPHWKCRCYIMPVRE